MSSQLGEQVAASMVRQRRKTEAWRQQASCWGAPSITPSTLATGTRFIRRPGSLSGSGSVNHGIDQVRWTRARYALAPIGAVARA